MSRVIHFEIHSDQPQRAVDFYSAAFGWKFVKWEGPMEYWLISTGEKAAPGIDGGLVGRRGPRPESGQPVNAYVCTIDVPAIDESLKKIQSLGGTNVVPKMAIPGVGWLAYCTDLEGNIFGIMQEDPTAK